MSALENLFKPLIELHSHIFGKLEIITDQDLIHSPYYKSHWSKPKSRSESNCFSIVFLIFNFWSHIDRRKNRHKGHICYIILYNTYIRLWVILTSHGNEVNSIHQISEYYPPFQSRKKILIDCHCVSDVKQRIKILRLWNKTTNSVKTQQNIVKANLWRQN